MDIEYQKNIASTVLEKLAKFIDSDAVIAGGAPRNWDHGWLAKDIDIFLRYPGNCCVDLLEKVEDALGFVPEYLSDRDVSEYNFGENIHIERIIGFSHLGVNFELICCSDQGGGDFIDIVMEHMDTGICCIYICMDQDVAITYTTAAYDKDINNSTITIFPDRLSDEQLRHTITKHLPRLMDYFPEHKIAIEQ